MQRYASIDQIARHNLDSLEVRWTRQGGGRSVPILIDNVLYAPNSRGLIDAFDPATGNTIWTQQPAPWKTSGALSPVIDLWARGRDKRLVVVQGSHLYTIDAATGRVSTTFGDSGRVDLLEPPATSFTGMGNSGPIVVGDVIVVGGTFDSHGDFGNQWKGRLPGLVRGYDARTGKQLWAFSAVPRTGEFGTATWGNESYKHAGDQGSWCCLSADEMLGYVYVPLTAPTAAYYGGHRPGDNLFSNSLVAIDVKTGKRVWHFQTVHHDLWEYDPVGAPTLGEITVGGRRIKAVMQASKTSFLYVFDRVTGKPVWPIEERPVPASTTPGEHTSPTQPFPVKPAPFDRQGLTYDDLIDWPEIKERARAVADAFVLGPIFTPAPLVQPGGKKGWIQIPGIVGGANWPVGAFDPETQTYYAISRTLPTVIGLTKVESATGDMDYAWSGRGDQATVDGIPIVKPPWGRITAIDMKTGDHRWQVANGDNKALRAHRIVQAANPPPLGTTNYSMALVTKTLLFIAEFGAGLRAYDKATGTEIWTKDLPGGITGAPMSYLHRGVQYIVVPTSNGWTALGLRRPGAPEKPKAP